nr:hypothetical protein HK105_000027 [Polyrhizophydium stewartii]
MASAEEDYYALLGLEFTATVQQIKKAFRHLFLRLTKARDVLSNDESRKAYDDLQRSKRLQQARFKEMDAQRQRDKRSLDEREKEAKRQRMATAAAGQQHIATEDEQRKMELERLREEGQRRMHALEQERRQAAAAGVALATLVDAARKAVAAADVVECTVKIKWRKDAPADRFSSALAVGEVLQPFGSVDRVLMGKQGKRDATVVFKDLYGAYAAIKAKEAGDARLADLALSWIAGPPKALEHIETALMGSDTVQPTPSSTGTAPATAQTLPKFVPTPSLRQFTPTSFPMQNASAGAGMDEYEKRTLLRMRQRERESLEREILEQEREILEQEREILEQERE